jgi:hypothetical protein
MDTTTAEAMGWPFLVAAGRRRDYTTLLAPGFLVDELDHGVLERVLRPDAGPERAAVVTARSGRGRPLVVVHATHLLTPADLDGDGPLPAGLGGGDARDEHGRPLRLIYGFTVPDVSTVEPDETDLRRAWERVLPAYRSFLLDEERATVVGSAPFRLRSAVGAPVPPPVDATAGGTRRWLGVLVVAALLAVVIAGSMLWVRRNAQPAPKPTACASATDVPPALPPASCPPTRLR